ncbi:MAG: MFS transporter [Candidatus Atabeyarchaeum deiterrae]
MTEKGSVTGFLALERNVITISISGSIATGFNAVWMPFVPLFMSGFLRLGPMLIAGLYTAMSLTAAVFMIISGRASNRLGRKPTIILARCLLVLAPLFLLLSISANAYIALPAMVLLGAGMGLGGPAASTLLTESVKAEKRGTALMVATRVFPSLPPIATSIVGGLLTAQGAFAFTYLLGTVGLATMLIVELIGLRETLRPEMEKPAQKMESGKSKSTLRPRDQFIIILSIAYALDSVSTQAISWYIPLYVTSLGYTAFLVGIMGSVLGAAVAVSALIGGKITDKIGRYQAIIISWGGLVPMLVLFTITQNYYLLLVTYALWVSFDLIDMAAPIAWISDRTEPKERALKISFFQSVSSFASIIGPTIGGLMLLLSSQGPFLFKMVAQLIALILIVVLVRRKRS